MTEITYNYTFWLRLKRFIPVYVFKTSQKYVLGINIV